MSFISNGKNVGVNGYLNDLRGLDFTCTHSKQNPWARLSMGLPKIAK